MLREVVFVAKLPLESYEVDVGGDNVPQPPRHSGERYRDPGAACLVIVSGGGNVDQLCRHKVLRENWVLWQGMEKEKTESYTDCNYQIFSPS